LCHPKSCTLHKPALTHYKDPALIYMDNYLVESPNTHSYTGFYDITLKIQNSCVLKTLSQNYLQRSIITALETNANLSKGISETPLRKAEKTEMAHAPRYMRYMLSIAESSNEQSYHLVADQLSASWKAILNAGSQPAKRPSKYPCDAYKYYT
jgi:hypothetical protein